MHADNNYQEYCHPRQSDIIERDCSLEWVAAELCAVSVILIPVDARGLRRGI